MPVFEPGSNGVGSDRSANCTTTTAHAYFFYFVNANILAMLLNDLSGYHITCTYDT